MEWDVLASGFGLPEAPTPDPAGALYFSDVLGGGVRRLDPSGELTIVVPKRRGVGGLALHADGGLVCSGRELVHVQATGESRAVLHVDGVAGWNDLGTDAAGRVYAGALRFAVFDRDAKAVPGEVWCVGPGADPTVAFDGVVHANGIAVAPDRLTVYCSDTRRRCVVTFDIANARRAEIDIAPYGEPDGLALDEQGALWVALLRGGIGRFRPDGTLDRRIEPPCEFVTSVAFAGRELYVTAGPHRDAPASGGCVLRTTVDVGGLPVAPARV